VLSHTPTMDAAEAEFSTALVAMVGGSRLTISRDQVHNQLVHHYRVDSDVVRVRRYRSDGFLVNFFDVATADRVLHGSQPQGVELVLIFYRWRRQWGARFAPLHFKVLLAVENISTHIWLVQSVQEIVNSSCMVFKLVLASLQAQDLSCFMVVAWAFHPGVIPQEIGCIVPEPEGPSKVDVSPLFLRASEIIHSRQDTLQFWAFIHILEIHDFTPPSDSSNEGGDNGGGPPDGSSDGDEYPVRKVISGSPDRETDPIRALIEGACRVWQWAPSCAAP
jgi:hypothetical protein